MHNVGLRIGIPFNLVFYTSGVYVRLLASGYAHFSEPDTMCNFRHPRHPPDRVYHDKFHSRNIDRLHGEIVYAQSFVKIFNFSKINAVHINKITSFSLPINTPPKLNKNTLLKMTTCTSLT
jgi:hypothetical protein